MAYIVVAYLVMVCVALVHEVVAVRTVAAPVFWKKFLVYVYSYGLYSDGLRSDGLYNYGQYSYGQVRYVLVADVDLANVVMAYIVMAYLVPRRAWLAPAEPPDCWPLQLWPL